MKKILKLMCVIFFLMPYSMQAQEDSLYESNVYEFINQIRFSHFDYPRTDTIKLRNFLSNKLLFSSVPLMAFKESYPNFFSELELHELAAKFNDDSTRFDLMENRIKKSKLLNDTIIDILNKGNFKEKNCTYWRFSKPCFIRNYTICAFSYEFCDNQDTLLFKKENEKWVFVAVLGRIYSDY